MVRVLCYGHKGCRFKSYTRFVAYTVICKQDNKKRDM